MCRSCGLLTGECVKVFSPFGKGRKFECYNSGFDRPPPPSFRRLVAAGAWVHEYLYLKEHSVFDSADLVKKASCAETQQPNRENLL